ncbi:MAG: hypothetical protein QNJ36_09170 [Calothrix sp. MO_167.B42]|nr:hypothetical protein [Calothrix sp. MO_167.B42]
MKQEAFGVETRQHSRALLDLYKEFGIYISPARKEYPSKQEAQYKEKSPFSPYIFS